MQAYVVRRLLLIIPALFFVTIVVFFAIRIIPGDIIDLMVSEQGTMTIASRAEIEHTLGLDVPIHVQYGRWMGDIILHGSLGESLWTKESVVQKILDRLPVSFELGLLAIMIGIIISFPIGVYSGMRQDTAGDYIGRSFAILCISIPSFWLGTMVVVYPSVWWGWSPSLDYFSFTEEPIENLKQFIIPAIILGMSLCGVTMRMMRTMVLEVLRQDYIRTAWAKGLRERVVVLSHVLKNALIPVITILGLMLPVVVSGAVILEWIFCLPGMGRLLVESASNRDYAIISGVLLVIAVAVLIINLVVDLTYGWFDPRIRYK